MRALRLTSLNRERSALLLRHFRATGAVLSQAEVAAREALLPFPPLTGGTRVTLVRVWRRAALAPALKP